MKEVMKGLIPGICVIFLFYYCERNPVAPAFTDDKYKRLKEYEGYSLGKDSSEEENKVTAYDHYDPDLVEDYNTEYDPYDQEYNPQDNSVKPPSEVTDRFEKHYPHAKEVHWRETGDTYEADFEIEGVKHYAQYDIDGNWGLTRREIDWKDAPGSIRKMRDPEMKVYKIYEEERPNQQEKTYVVHLGKEVFFDKDGKMIDKKDISGKKD